MSSHRPYAKDPKSPPSVTTVLDCLSKPGLPWAAARETAEFAVRHPENWQQDEPDKAVERLRKHHRGVWDHRALMGSLVHRVNETWALGQEVRLGDLIEELQASSRLWRNMTAWDIREEVRPMVKGLSEAWQAIQPETLDVETVVRYRDPELSYIGSTDWRALANRPGAPNRLPWLIDAKTTGNLKEGSAHYWDTWRLQLAAYRYATETVVYDDEDQEIDTGPVIPVAGTAILLVRADGQWEFLPVSAGEAEHAVFMSLRRAYGWLNGDGKGPGNGPS